MTRPALNERARVHIDRLVALAAPLRRIAASLADSVQAARHERKSAAERLQAAELELQEFRRANPGSDQGRQHEQQKLSDAVRQIHGRIITMDRSIADQEAALAKARAEAAAASTLAEALIAAISDKQTRTELREQVA